MSRPRALGCLVLVAALLIGLAPVSAEAIERLYARFLYAHLQPAVTGLSSLLPVAILDVAIGLILAGAVVILARRRSPRDPRQLRGVACRVAVAAGWILVAVAAVYVWFALFWGLNYRRVPLEQKLAFDASRVTREHALAFGQLAVARINDLAGAADAAVVDDQALASALAEVERALGSTRNARVARPKWSLLTWYFRQAAIDGMTDPFFLEIILNPDLLPFERPFVLAHEWAHLAGYADEAEANFVAWLACVRGAPASEYSGWLAAYQHVAAQLPRPDRQMLRAALAPGAAADLEASRQRLARSRPVVRTAARGAYDAYLRANRVDEGIASYDAVVRLMLGTAFDARWTPELRR